MPSERARPHVAVIGGGIAGLAAAWSLVRADEAPRVTVLEGSPRCGGKLAVGEVAGVTVDQGAEQVLLRRPEALTLLTELGLRDALIHPATSAAAVLVDGRLRPLPARTLLGVPADLRALRRSRVVGRRAVVRAALEPWRRGRPPRHDVPVGPYLRHRLGSAIVDRLVEPLLGGVYAGHADRLSLAATMPQLWAALPEHGSVLRAARAAMPSPGPAKGGSVAPLFGSLPGGLGSLVPPLVEALTARGVEVRLSAMVRELTRANTGWRVVAGSTRSRDVLDVDAVVLALPARPAARLLAGAGSVATARAAAALSRIDYASMALVTLAFDSLTLRGSGFLVPPGEGRAVKAATFTSVKWARSGPSLVRLSYGRHGEEAVLQRDDADLVRLAVADLASITGATGRLLDAKVSRWGGGLPQYAPGHLDLVAEVRAALAEAPGLAVCGAAYDGVGVPACIGSARSAAAAVLGSLRRLGE